MPDRYIPIIYSGGETVFDYITDANIFISESGSIAERFKSMEIQQSADIESYLEDGAQKIGDGVFGKSITDPCLGWEKTEKLIYDIAEQV